RARSEEAVVGVLYCKVAEMRHSGGSAAGELLAAYVDIEGAAPGRKESQADHGGRCGVSALLRHSLSFEVEMERRFVDECDAENARAGRNTRFEDVGGVCDEREPPHAIDRLFDLLR